MRCLKMKNIAYAIALALLMMCSISTTNGGKIIGVFTTISPSHIIVYMSAMRALAEAGHNITVVLNQKPKITHPSITEVIIPPTEEQQILVDKVMNKISSKKSNFPTMLWNVITSMDAMITLQRDILLDKRFKELYKEKFDLVFLGYFLNDFQLGLAAKFQAPIIVAWTGPPAGFVNDFVGNPIEVAYVPNSNVAVQVGEKMTFLERIQNFISIGFGYTFKMIVDLKTRKFYGELFGDEENFPTLYEMKRNVSLVFCNSHFSEGPIRPNVPGVVEIGGIQIKPQPDPLPRDIAEFLDSSKKDGAILFSLGTNLKGSNIKPEIIDIIFKTLASLKQKVIWKWEDLDNVPGKSPNILYKKWLPQDDVLAHPNLKLFITHAGKGGIAEAQYHAVPMLALPVFADQPGNADKLLLSGYGLQLDLFSMTAEHFRNAILEVIENPVYKANIQQFSNLYRDRPLSAQESVVYWTEYVMRHRGAKHMQSPLVFLNFFQRLSLDVIGFIVLVLYIIFKFIKFIVKLLIAKFSSKNKLKIKNSSTSYEKLKTK